MLAKFSAIVYDIFIDGLKFSKLKKGVAMLNELILAIDKGQIIMWVVVAVVLVLMFVLTIIPQRKRQKEQQKMMESLAVGTKLMTVGGLVGKIAQINNDNTLIVNVGTETNPTLIVIDQKAVGYVLESVAAPKAEPAESKAEEKPAEEVPAKTEDGEAAPEDVKAEEAPEKEAKEEVAENEAAEEPKAE